MPFKKRTNITKTQKCPKERKKKKEETLLIFYASFP
jgi:hypothetical protein